MNVLHLIDTLGRGGAETLLLDVCTASPKHGISPCVLASGGGILEQEFRDRKLKIIRTQRERAVDVALVRLIRSVIREHRIDVIHAHQPVCALHALIATRSTPVPVVNSIHGLVEDLKNKLIFRPLSSRVDANVIVSHAMLRMCRDNFWMGEVKNPHVIYNGIDSRRAQAGKPTVREQIGLEKGDLLIGMTGNFFNTKDHLTVCRAVKILRDAGICVHLAFAGNFSDKKVAEECKQFVRESNLSDSVHFLGSIDSIADFLASLDLFVFSTLRDSFGIAVVEAMMAGVPCILSDSAAMLEMSENGRFAELFITANATDLAYKISLLIANLALQNQRRDDALQYAQAKFSIDSHIKQLKDLYSSLCQPKSSSRTQLELPIRSTATLYGF